MNNPYNQIQLERKARQKREALQAYEYYKVNLSLRETAKIMGKSHEWVRNAIKRELSTDDVLTKNDSMI